PLGYVVAYRILRKRAAPMLVHGRCPNQTAHRRCSVAENKPKSRKPFRQDKFPVYQSLFRINEAFEVIDAEMAMLENSHVLPPEPLYRYKTTELRAGISHRLLDLLITREERDWHFWQ